MLVVYILTTIILATLAAVGYLYYRGQKNIQQENGFLQANKKQIEEENKNKPIKCIILFGTQTGTAQRFSQSLGQQLQDLYNSFMSIKIDNMETIESLDDLKKYNLVFFLVATYGDGEPTDDTANFHQWITEMSSAIENGESEPTFQGINYGVFGLGNRQYEHFNKEGQVIDVCMKQLGASAVCKRGEGDDDEDIQADFEQWSEQLNKTLPKALGDLVPQEETQDSINLNINKRPSLEIGNNYEIMFLDKQEQEDKYEEGELYNPKKPVKGQILEVRELYQHSAGRSCIFVSIKLPEDKIESLPAYDTGDHIGIVPINQEDLVERVGKRLGVPLEQVISLKPPTHINGSNILPPNVEIKKPLSFRQALSQLVELAASPTKGALKALSYFASDKEQQDRLFSLTQPKNQQMFKEYITIPKRSLVEVIEEFDSVQIPLGVFFSSVATPLQPRLYSISSGALRHPTEVHITVAVIEEVTGTGRMHKGAASKYLWAAQKGSHIPIYIRHSTFKLPKQPSNPVLMVGPGTGIAPFMGFLSDMQYQIQNNQISPNNKFSWLYFGCRNPQHDFLYEEQLKGYQKDNILDKFRVAFSRITENKIYVQNLIEEDKDSFFDKLDQQGGYLYICGDKRMAQDVHKLLLKSAQSSGIQDPEKWLEQLSQQNRYQKDVW